MTATAGRVGYGLTIERKTGVSTWEALAELYDITPPNVTMNTPDATNFTSPNAHREKIAGLLSAGDCTLACTHLSDNTTQAALRTAQANRSKESFRIKLPVLGSDVYGWTFDAFVAEVGDNTPLDDKLVFNVRLSVTGKPTFGVIT